MAMNEEPGAKETHVSEEILGLPIEKRSPDLDAISLRPEGFPQSRELGWTPSERKPVGYMVRKRGLRMALVRVYLFFLPSFLHSRVSRKHTRLEKLSPTSYLDGMRGVAALCVFFCHYFYQSFIVAEGWGSAPHNNQLLKLPIIRLFYQGPPAVCLFFVISGYALSYKPLTLIRTRHFDKFVAIMSSMTFRRFLRLYVPTTISTFMVVILLRLGVYEWTREYASDKTCLKNILEPHPERLETTWEQLVHWSWNMYEFVHVFGWERFGGSTSK